MSLVRSDTTHSSLRPPVRRDPREDEITGEFFMADELPPALTRPRDRGTLVVLEGASPGAVFRLGEQELVVGRSLSSHLPVDEPSLSRRHARIFARGGSFFVEDLQSRNGTFVNGLRVEAPRRLRDGDQILFGLVLRLRFMLQDEAEQAAAQALYESAVRDPLTGLFNRRHLDERLQAEQSFALRHGTDLSLMLIDLDFFKAINDTYGHVAGDLVLKVVARCLVRMLRLEDLVARFGGEELCVVGRSLDARNAEIVADRCRRAIEALKIPWDDGPIRVTASIGVATQSAARSFPTPEALLEAADQALYRAKAEGRNAVRHA